MNDASAAARAGIPQRFVRADGKLDAPKLRAESSITAVASKVTAMRRSGGGTESKGLCPLHSEITPSFHVNEGKGAFHCFGCGAGGDVIGLYSRLYKTTFLESCAALAGATTPLPISCNMNAKSLDRDRARYRAVMEWRRASLIEGSLAEAYLLSRGIAASVPHSLRFSHVPRFWHDDGREGQRHPAMIAAVQNEYGTVVGIHRTFLDADGRKCRRGQPRLALGRIRGCAVRLGPVAPKIMLCSAIEDGLALRLMFPGATVWVTPGDANLPYAGIPSGIRHVTICGDDDTSGKAAVECARRALAIEGRSTASLFPRAGKDFNDEWLLLHA